MQVKRFFAPSMPEALRMVRSEMGDDAVILSSKRVDDGVEIVTALDYDEGEVRSQLGVADEDKANASRLAELQAEKHRKLEAAMAKSRAHISDVQQRSQHTQEPVTPAAVGGGETEDESPLEGSSQQEDGLASMRAEIHSLRDMLQQMNGQQTPATPGEKTPGVVEQRLGDRLQDLGLSRTQARDLAAEHGQGRLDAGWKSALKALAAKLETVPADPLERGGIYALLGPTGSGKTTTIGKMAAQFVLRHGAEQLALVTTDRYRVAAHEQLFVFGRILNVPVRVVDEANSLDAILDDLSDRKLVLIDTAGLTAADRGWEEQIDELVSSRHAVRPYLLISATSQPRIMQSTWHCYNAVGLAGCILTKTDEALTLGEVVGFAAQSRLPVAFYTNGQKIPDDLHRAGAADLVKQAVRRHQALNRGDTAMAEGA
ncbi:MAG: flagellar biosynthesis protein FlhF [Pseudomonadota bacterium]